MSMYVYKILPCSIFVRLLIETIADPQLSAAHQELNVFLFDCQIIKLNNDTVSHIAMSTVVESTLEAS